MREHLPLSNKEILTQRYGPVADGIALLFSGYLEVVLHDLESQSVVYIANPASKREPGYPSNLDDIKFNPDENVIGPYEKINWDGKKVRSSSAVLRNDVGEAIGLFCLNFITSDFHLAKDVLERLLAGINIIPQPDKLFRDDWQEKINVFVNSWIAQHNTSLNSLSRNDKRTLVKELYDNGAFKSKNSQDYIANVLNMGRTTVFKYLREFKSSETA